MRRNTGCRRRHFCKISHCFSTKLFLKGSQYDCNYVNGTLAHRYDDAKAQLTVTKVNELLMKLEIPLIENQNITCNQLGKKGLHLNQHGIGKLAINFIKTLCNL